MRRQDYTVGWICAVQTEYVAACELLDEEHPLLLLILTQHHDSGGALGPSDPCVILICAPLSGYICSLENR